MVHATRILAATLFTSVLLCHSPSSQAQSQSPWIFTADALGVHQNDTDMTDTGGSFNVDRWFVSGGVTFAWNARDMVGVSIGGGKSIYDFDGQGGFAGGDPWNNVSDTRLTFIGRMGFGDTGVLTLVPTIRVNGESGASTGDSTTYGLFAAASWRLSESLTIGPGIGVFTRLEDGVRVFPVLAVDWDISDRWNLATGSGVASSQGPGLTLRYKLNDDWSFGLTGRYEDLEFRLDDKGVAPNGIGRDQSFPMVVSVQLKPNNTFQMSLFAGAQMMGQLRLEDSKGKKLQETDYDAALIVGASIEARF